MIALSSQQNLTTVIDCDEEDLHRYTSGRWLWNEAAQLSARRVDFNFEALQRVAAEAIGARACVDVTKMTEGNFNKVFLMEMDDGRQVIAKLPNPNVGPAGIITASEVATMDFVSLPAKV